MEGLDSPGPLCERKFTGGEQKADSDAELRDVAPRHASTADGLPKTPNHMLLAYKIILIKLKLLDAMSRISKGNVTGSTAMGLDLAIEALEMASTVNGGEDMMTRCCYWIGVAIYRLGRGPPFDRKTYWFEEARGSQIVSPEHEWAARWIERIVQEEDESNLYGATIPDAIRSTWKTAGSAITYIGSLWKAPVGSELPTSQSRNRPVAQGSACLKPRSNSVISIVSDRTILERIPSFGSIGSHDSVPSSSPHSQQGPQSPSAFTDVTDSTESHSTQSAASLTSGSKSSTEYTSSRYPFSRHDNLKRILETTGRNSTSYQSTNFISP